MVAIQDWLEPVIDGVCEIGYEGVVDPDNEIMQRCAYFAYSQVVAYCLRYFHKNDWVEAYTVENGKLYLKHTPISSITEILLFTGEEYDEEMEADDDYYLYGDNRGYIQFPGRSNSDFRIKVTYTAGTEEAGAGDSPASDALLQALIWQTLANFNTKDVIGVSSIHGGWHGNITRLPNLYKNSRGIILQVMDILEPYRYYGNAEEW